MRKLGVYGCVALLAMAAAACGDDGGDDTTSGTGGSGATTSSTGGSPTSTGTDGTGGSTGSGTGSGGDATSGTGTGGGDASPAATIESDDGSARLVLAEGALPDGVSVDDIAVTAIPIEEAFPDGLEDPSSYIAGYRLEPDGLAFEIPARLEIDGEVPEGRFVYGALLSEASVDVLAPSITVDDGSVLGVAAEVPHFSDAFFMSGAAIGAATVRSGLRNARPGGPTSIAVRVTPVLFGSHEPTESLRRGNRFFDVSVAWQTTTWALVDSHFQTVWHVVDENDVPSTIDGNLLPESPRNPAEVVELQVVRKDLRQRFTCKNVGTMTTTYSTKIEVMATVTLTPQDGSAAESEERLVQAWVAAPSSEADCANPISDGIGDFIDSVSTNDPSYTSDAIDIEGYAGARLTVGEDEAAALYEGVDAVYPCGESVEDALVVCAAGAAPMPAGDVLVFTTTMVGDVPVADEGRAYTHALVLDSDDDPENDWIYNPPYDWDLFRDTDRWYQLVWIPELGWRVYASQVQFDQTVLDIPTSVRAIVQGRTVEWHVPASELASEDPGFRATSFGHDGSFDPADRGADVGGADPTEPLTSIE